MARHSGMRGLCLVSIKVEDLYGPVLVQAIDYAVLVVTENVDRLVAVGHLRALAPERYDVDAVGDRTVLHEPDHGFLVLDILQNAVAEDDVEGALWDIRCDIRDFNADPIRDSGLRGKSPDLRGTNLADLHGFDRVAEQCEPDRIRALSGSDIERPAGGSAGDSAERHLGEQRCRVGHRVGAVASVLAPPVSVPVPIEPVEVLAYLHRGRLLLVWQQGTDRQIAWHGPVLLHSSIGSEAIT